VGSTGDDTRRRIIAATMECVATRGYARATIREIARVAGMTSGSLYHYFPTKAEIIKAAYVEVGAATMPRLVAAAEEAGRAGGAVDKLVALMHEGGLIMEDFPYAVAFDLAVRGPGVEADLLDLSENIFASLRQFVEDIIEQASADGLLSRQVTTRGATNAVLALMRALYDHHASVLSPEDFHATVDAVRLMLRGELLPRG
jgi:AcrR family transcriptional regulator